MRIPLIALLGTFACAGCASGYRLSGGPNDGSQDTRAPLRPNVAAARELDQQGVRSFLDGRYADAIRYFQAAHRLGGPSSELWNIARSRERLDDAEGAVRAIEEYLAQRDLSPADRAEADREERSLNVRSSVLTVTTTPVGATVAVDGKAASPATTPLSAEVSPGRHVVDVRLEGYAAETKSIDARLGRAVILSLDLAPARK
jgi:hypothetical protein